MSNIKEKRGITLIALAVTIVVILILAGVTIDVTLGENGILNKSKEAADRMNNLVKEDEAELNELLNELNETMGSNWNSNIEIPEPDPEPPKLEDTTGIQDETVTVEDEYGNKVTIPKGFEVVEEEGTTVPEGIVIQDKDGNQFVWIPVGRVYKDNTGTNYSDIQLGRYTFDTNNGTPTPVQLAYTEESPENYKQLVTIDSYYQEYATRSNPDGNTYLNTIAKDLGKFVDSVRNNGGYYLARYEASYGSGSSVADYKPFSKVSIGTIRTDSSATLTQGTLWNCVSQIDAAKISRNMYNNDSNVGVESDLANSYAWDTAIVFIQEMGNTNYANNKQCVQDSISNTGTLGDEVCNVNDMATNCYDWTTEYSFNGENNCVFRGGSPFILGGTNTAHRNSWNNQNTNTHSFVGFRVILYLKISS